MNEVQWLEKCVDATAVSDVDSEDVNLLLAALGIFGGLIYSRQLMLERIDDLEHLEELLLAAPYTQSLEAFTQNLQNRR